MFSVALSIIAKKWETSQMSHQMLNRFKKCDISLLWDITIKRKNISKNVRIWVNLEDIVLSERRLT